MEFERQAATAPLTRTLEGELIRPDLHDARVIGGRGAVMGKERDLGSRVGIGRMSIESFAPGIALGIIDLAEGEHLPLSDAPVVESFVFDHTPAGVFLAIFFADLSTQKHNDWREYTPGGRGDESGSSLQTNLQNARGHSLANPLASSTKKIETRVQSATEGQTRTPKWKERASNI